MYREEQAEHLRMRQLSTPEGGGGQSPYELVVSECALLKKATGPHVFTAQMCHNCNLTVTLQVGGHCG